MSNKFGYGTVIAKLNQYVNGTTDSLPPEVLARLVPAIQSSGMYEVMQTYPPQFKALLVTHRKELETNRDGIVVYDNGSKIAHIEKIIPAKRRKFLQELGCTAESIGIALKSWKTRNLKSMYMLIFISKDIPAKCCQTPFIEYCIEYSSKKWVKDAYPRVSNFVEDKISNVESCIYTFVDGYLDRLIDPNTRKSIMRIAATIVKQSYMHILKSSNTACYVCDTQSSKVHYKQCGGCRLIYYCSEECQRKHWKHNHRFKCLALQSNLSRFRQMVELMMNWIYEAYNRKDEPRDALPKIDGSEIEHKDDLDE